MTTDKQRIEAFCAYAATLAGDEKGEAQVFCDRLFQAFGHAGYKEAGATLEFRTKRSGGRTTFADLVWKPRLLLEMKSRGERLARHYPQAFDYWLRLVPHRPRYVVLCNFDEFWIYDFDRQVDDPVDKLGIRDLPKGYVALNFMFADDRPPRFTNDRVAVTLAAARSIAQVIRSAMARGESRERTQRFLLQCVVAMFAEDCDLLPRSLFSSLLDDCVTGQGTARLLGDLFRQMNEPVPTAKGRYAKVPYFNGGLFETIDPIDLSPDETRSLREAANEDWEAVQPPIFGTLFQESMEERDRHVLGAHFTSEADIRKLVFPVIVRPWQQRIAAAKTLKDLQKLRKALLSFTVLDPACGSGNFLYVAYREMRRLELDLLARLRDSYRGKRRGAFEAASLVSTRQFHGIDTNRFAVELAKVTLMLGKELSFLETQAMTVAGQVDFKVDSGDALPLDNLERNIVCDDALFCAWPEVDAIIGNPPFQSKNKMQKEFGRAYVNRLRARYPEIPGRADYCVYWFRRAHDELGPGGRAGLVGTNTIRQTYSRAGGLDYILGNGGEIIEAVGTQVWSGDAKVHVSLVNWAKGPVPGAKKLYWQEGNAADSPWAVAELDAIPASLSTSFDVGDAEVLKGNRAPKRCFQGQTHGHEGFLLSREEAAAHLNAVPESAQVLFPYLIADELIGSYPPAPSRFVIDFGALDVVGAARHGALFDRIKTSVLPDRKSTAAKEDAESARVLAEDPSSRVNRHHRNFLAHWWQLSYAREDLLQVLRGARRYVVCGRVTKRPIFEFVSTSVRPNDALMAFPFEDDYSFGVLQSGMHWRWFQERCSTLKGDWRYTSNTVFDTFPWPQGPDRVAVRGVAEAARELRRVRRELMQRERMSFRELYRLCELPGVNPLKPVAAALDAAVRRAYGMRNNGDPLVFLLELNHALARVERSGAPVIGPGIPPSARGDPELSSDDCLDANGFGVVRSPSSA